VNVVTNVVPACVMVLVAGVADNVSVVITVLAPSTMVCTSVVGCVIVETTIEPGRVVVTPGKVMVDPPCTSVCKIVLVDTVVDPGCTIV